MCKAVEKYANERELFGKSKGKIETQLETVKNMLKKGFDLDIALDLVNMDKDTYNKYAKGVQ